MRVNRWRHQHGIPDEVFVRIYPLASKSAAQKKTTPDGPEAETTQGATGPAEAPPQPAEPAAAAAPPDTPPTEEAATPAAEDPARPPAPKPFTKGSRDLYKPQYIDFRNPLLVGLFGKMTTNLKTFSVVLEERYPTAESLPHHQDRAFAS